MALNTQDSGVANPNGQGNLPLANPNVNMQNVTPINTSQPSPTSVTPITPAQTPPNTPYTIQSGDTLSQIAQKQGTTVAQIMAANPSITDPNKIQAGASLNLKYNNALSQVQGTTPPTSQSEANSQIQDITSKSGQTSVDQQQQQAGVDSANAITQKLQSDPGYQQLMADQQQYLSQQNQQQTLQQQYTNLTNQAGVPAIDTQLLNMKSILDGTENDIRQEITAAGGMATNSQVLALSAARNKTLSQNYNNLLQTRDSLVNQINTTMGFAKEDAANATALASEKMNFDKQIIDYTQKFTQNAQDAYNKIISTPGYGYKALYASTGGDQHTTSMIEDTLGLSPGSLKSLAETNSQAWGDPYKLGGDYVQKNNQTGEIRTAVNVPAGVSGSTSGSGTGIDTGVTIPGDPTSQSILSHTGLSIPAFSFLTQGTSALTRMTATQRLQYMNEAQDWANNKGIDLATFQSQYKAYNEALQKNIAQFNNVKKSEGELEGTLANIQTAADEASFKNMKWENVAKMFAGQQFNDANVSKYAFHLNQLRSELSQYNAAAAGKTSTDQADQAEAERIIKDGFAAGSIKGFQSALKVSVDKMDNILQQNITRTNGQVWNLFGVTKPTQSLGTPKDSQTVEALLNKNGYNYNELITKMMSPGALKEGQFPAVDAVTGQPYGATRDEIKSGKYIAL